MNGKTARLINKAAGRAAADGNGRVGVRKPIGQRTKTFWGGVFNAWRKMRRVVANAAPPPPPPEWAIVETDSHTQARKALKRQWQRQTGRERERTRNALARGLNSATA